MLVTLPVTTLPAGITAWSNAYTASTSFAETGWPVFAMRTFWSTETRSEVPAGTLSKITVSAGVGARISDVGGAHRKGNASSRGTSLQPPGTAFCAYTPIGADRKIRNSHERRRSL